MESGHAINLSCDLIHPFRAHSHLVTKRKSKTRDTHELSVNPGESEQHRGVSFGLAGLMLPYDDND